jgi:Lon protease-like protein
VTTERRRDLPLFPLGTVLFPGSRLPLRIFEPRYLAMLRDCLRDGSGFGVCLIQEGREVGAPAMPADMGCLASIIEWEMPETDLYHVMTVGSDRFRVLTTHTQVDGLLRGDVVTLEPEAGVPVPESHRLCVDVLRQLIERVGEAWFPPPHHFEDASWVSYRLAEVLPFDAIEKQRMLVANDPIARLDRALHLIRRG